MISADDSFTPPAIPVPPWSCARPTARATTWICAGSGSTRSGTPGGGRRCSRTGIPVRDPDAERAILAGLDVGLERHGLRGRDSGDLVRAGHAARHRDHAVHPRRPCPCWMAIPASPSRSTASRPTTARRATRCGSASRPGRRRAKSTGSTSASDHRRGARGPVRRRVRGAEPGRVAPAAGRRRVLLAGEAGAAGAAPADRRGPGAAGDAGRPAADQPVPGRAVGRARRARRDRRPRRRRGSARSAACWRSSSVAPMPLPAALSAQLRPYQVDGFSWLAFLWEHRLGGILADDMGLGKTVQALALICHARQARPGLAPFLVVAPTSVVANWVAEAARFAPGLTRGGGLGHAAQARPGRCAEIVAGADVVVTSYTLFRLDSDAYAAARLVRADPRRGAVRQEPPVQGLPVRPEAARAVQARDHRHADGEQPDGAVVAAVDHRARAVPQPGPVPRVLRPADREDGDRRAARAAAPPDPAAGHAAHQGAGGRGPAGQAGAGARGRAASPAPHGLPAAPAAGAAEGARPDRRPRRTTGSRSCGRSPCCAS